MNYILFILLSIILQVFSAKGTKPKLCIDCKHFIKDNGIGKFGKCSLSPKLSGRKYYLVNGVIDESEYEFCCLSRANEDICGEDGKLYKKKYKNRDLKK